MKNSILIAGMILLAASCSNDECGNFVENNGGYTPVTVSVSGFSVEQGDFPGTGGMTRATAVGDYTGVKFLTLAFYASNGTEVYKHTQEKGNLEQGETFGEFSTPLPIGSYTMVVLGYVLYDDDALTLTSPTQAEWTVNAPRETFAATQEVNVTNTTALNLSATLDRIVAQLKVISTDKRTANVEKVRMTFAAGGKQFSPTT
ncbi:MAG: FimB/Mfa2 family fimbrial subunit, partial [Prevotella sp.]|nr:FimB/Mfa2 family fimbrial subunit [Prevotella sp.]